MCMLNRKKAILFCLVLALMVSLCGCGKKEEAGMPRFYVGVEGAELKVFSAVDYTELEQVTTEAENAKTYRGDDIKMWRAYIFRMYWNLWAHRSIRRNTEIVYG